MVSRVVKDFRERLAKLDREEILELINQQDPELIKGINRIEWVFENKLTHLGIEGRPLTNEELALILDPPFIYDEDLAKAGLSIDQQKQIHIASDIVLWSKDFLNLNPRVYQILMLRDPALRKVYRLGRRAGKTFSLAVQLLHYAYTTPDGRCLVMAPMKSQVGLIYEEVMKLSRQGPVIEAITRNVTSPQYEIHLSTGSTIRFFTTGIKSGSKSDVARGQEAHMIILDEMDYMGVDDIDALYAMLQKTDENQPDKQLIAASTPTGRRERFWEWATRSPYFKEFYYPSYSNPYFTAELEEEMRDIYSPMAYRHEIEADWGEDSEGVYPRKYVDQAFQFDWKYVAARTSARSVHLMGVDWDKYGAGPNICILEVCDEIYEDEKFQSKIRVAHREEIPRNEYVLTEAVERIIELNDKFNPMHIYVDRGYGEVQVELLHQYGVEHPNTGLKKKVKGVSFSETFEIIDPASKQPAKKEMKPFMVENLRQMLESDLIYFPSHDEELYMQLISYVVARVTQTGRPVFEASGTQKDHAHDALILACLAYAQNYSDLMKVKYATRARSFSGGSLTPMIEPSNMTEEKTTSSSKRNRSQNKVRRQKIGRSQGISRKTF